MFRKNLDLTESNIFISPKKLSKISFDEVFMDVMFYRDKYDNDEYKCEFEKFKDSFGHMNRFVKIYKKMKWYETKISILNLLNVYMFPTGWLRRYACDFDSCTGFSRSECIHCFNKSMKIFRLDQCIKNFTDNDFSEKIYSIKKRIEDCKLESDFLFITLVQDKKNKFFVLDGNSRLLSYAIYLNDGRLGFDFNIKCYIGLIKDVIL